MIPQKTTNHTKMKNIKEIKIATGPTGGFTYTAHDRCKIGIERNPFTGKDWITVTYLDTDNNPPEEVKFFNPDYLISITYTA